MAHFNDDLPFDVSNSDYTSQSQMSNNKLPQKKQKPIKEKNINNVAPVQKPQKLRTKLKSDSIDIDDLEQLNEQNLKNFRARSRRNRAIIIILAIFLVLAIVAVGIYIAITQMSNNCYLYVQGASAKYVLDGKELEKFRSPADIQSFRIYRFDPGDSIKLKINAGGKYNVRCEVKVYMKDKQLTNVLIYELNEKYFKRESSNSFVSTNPIDGNQVIDLCQGVILDGEYSGELSIENFKLEMFTYLEKVG